MPRPRYQLVADDVPVVHRWIKDRFRTDCWPKDWPHLTAWDRFPREKPIATTLQQWCDRFLDAAQWKQVQAVIRAARRDMRQSRTVRLSRNAHETLRRLAQREHTTLSDVIVRYLSGIAEAPAAAPPVHCAVPSPAPPAVAKAPGVPIAPDTVADTTP
jgi:hypothetical protein